MAPSLLRRFWSGPPPPLLGERPIPVVSSTTIVVVVVVGDAEAEPEAVMLVRSGTAWSAPVGSPAVTAAAALRAGSTSFWLARKFRFSLVFSSMFFADILAHVVTTPFNAQSIVSIFYDTTAGRKPLKTNRFNDSGNDFAIIAIFHWQPHQVPTLAASGAALAQVLAKKNFHQGCIHRGAPIHNALLFLRAFPFNSTGHAPLLPHTRTLPSLSPTTPLDFTPSSSPAWTGLV